MNGCPQDDLGYVYMMVLYVSVSIPKRGGVFVSVPIGAGVYACKG